MELKQRRQYLPYAMAHLEGSIVSHPSSSRAYLIVICILSSSSMQFLLIIYSELIQNNSPHKNNNNTKLYPTAMAIIEGRRWIEVDGSEYLRLRK